MKLIIGKIEKIKENNIIKISSKMTYGDESYSLEYEYDISMDKFVVTERSDAFVISLLPFAMLKARKDENLVIETVTPISAELYHQIVNFYIPVLVRNISYYGNIRIIENISKDKIDSVGAVGTGVSGGVDSSYTLAKYSCDNNNVFKLTHGVFFNLGVYDGFDSIAEKNLEAIAKRICSEVGIECIVVKNNIISQIYQKCFGAIVPSIMMGGILSLQKLFGIYYLSAEVAAEEICFDDSYACFYDWLSSANFSTNSMRFYCSGFERKRLDKIKYISKFNFVQRYLSVCTEANNEKGNCSKCAKCTSAMVSLDSIGMLESFSKVFDVDYYKNNLDYYLSYIIMKNKGNDIWCTEIYKEYEKNKGGFSESAKKEALKKWKERGGTSNNPNKVKIEDIIM